jgi:hypothetical protein
MQYLVSVAPVVLCMACLLPACSDGARDSAESQSIDTQGELTVNDHRCFRNEYAFENQPGQKDVQDLSVVIDGEHATGDYNWRPAFKDKRIGRFDGTFDGRSVTASYEFSQEGQTATSAITILLEADEAVITGERPELGLDATIARVEC